MASISRLHKLAVKSREAAYRAHDLYQGGRLAAASTAHWAVLWSCPGFWDQARSTGLVDSKERLAVHDLIEASIKILLEGFAAQAPTGSSTWFQLLEILAADEHRRMTCLTEAISNCLGIELPALPPNSVRELSSDSALSAAVVQEANKIVAAWEDSLCSRLTSRIDDERRFAELLLHIEAWAGSKVCSLHAMVNLLSTVNQLLESDRSHRLPVLLDQLLRFGTILAGLLKSNPPASGSDDALVRHYLVRASMSNNAIEAVSWIHQGLEFDPENLLALKFLDDCQEALCLETLDLAVTQANFQDLDAAFQLVDSLPRNLQQDPLVLSVREELHRRRSAKFGNEGGQSVDP